MTKEEAFRRLMMAAEPVSIRVWSFRLGKKTHLFPISRKRASKHLAKDGG